MNERSAEETMRLDYILGTQLPSGIAFRNQLPLRQPACTTTTTTTTTSRKRPYVFIAAPCKNKTRTSASIIGQIEQLTNMVIEIHPREEDAATQTESNTPDREVIFNQYLLELCGNDANLFAQALQHLYTFIYSK
jgi:hypothetical protein